MTPQTQTLLEALKYVEKFYGRTMLIKLGGSILDCPERMKTLCEDLKCLRAAGIALVIVHGGSKAIEQALNAYQLTWEFHQGQRVTTPEMMTVIEMVLSGQVNKQLVRQLNQLNVKAMGFSGVDNRLLLCEQASEQLGLVGAIKQVNTQWIQSFLEDQLANPHGGMIPVISPVGVDAQGQSLNVNADWAASEIATALGVDKLVYLTDQEGIYHGEKLLSECSSSKLNSLIDANIVQGGMLTKVKTILDAINQGIQQIHILGAKRDHVLIDEIFTDAGVGTLCFK